MLPSIKGLRHGRAIAKWLGVSMRIVLKGICIFIFFAISVNLSGAAEHFVPDLGNYHSGMPNPSLLPIEMLAPDWMVQDVSTTETRSGDFLSQLSLNYFGIFFSPPKQPFLVKNFVGANYPINDLITVGATAYWTFQTQANDAATLQDPFIRVADNSVFNFDGLNLYVDGRINFPVAPASRAGNMFLGLQSVQALSYGVNETPLTLGAYGSIRYNTFGSQGFGDEWELYFAPNAFYQLSRTVALSILYEFQSSRYRQNGSKQWTGVWVDLEPGVSWDILPNLNVNPYLHFPVQHHFSWSNTAVGMLVSWVML